MGPSRSFWNGAMSNSLGNLCKEYKSFLIIAQIDTTGKGLTTLNPKSIPASYESPANGRVGSGGTR